MAGKKLGKDSRLYIKDAAGTTYTTPSGQGNLTVNRSSTPQDTTTKEDWPYGSSQPGPKSLSLSQALIPNLPDAGYARLKALDASGEPAIIEVRVPPYANDSLTFQASMYVAFGNTEHPQSGAVTTSVTLTAAAAPTVDTI